MAVDQSDSAVRRGGPSRFLLGRVGRRGAALLFFAFLDIVYCVSLLDPPHEALRSPTLYFLSRIAPLWVLGGLWGLAGVLCLVNAFRTSDKVGFAAAIAIKTLWGLLYIVGAVAGLDRAYVGATVWLSMAGWIAIISTWPEPPTGAVRLRTLFRRRHRAPRPPGGGETGA